MKAWLRRVAGADDKRGTLTILTGGGVVIGMPHGTTDAAGARVRDSVNHWLGRNARGPLALPWPADVTDLR